MLLFATNALNCFLIFLILPSDGMNLTGITDLVTAANSNTLAYSPANRLNYDASPLNRILN